MVVKLCYKMGDESAYLAMREYEKDVNIREFLNNTDDDNNNDDDRSDDDDRKRSEIVH